MRRLLLILVVCCSLVKTMPVPASQRADVFFLLDSSSSVWIVDFWKQLSFVAKMVDTLNVTSGQSRVGAATFSNYYYHQISLNSGLTADELKVKINAIPYTSGNTYTNEALRGMRDIGFHVDVTREGVAKIGVLLTDGCSQYGGLTVEQATLTKKQNITLFAIGIGDKVCPNELNAVASRPSYVMQVPDYDSLMDIQKNLTEQIRKVRLNDTSNSDQGKCRLHEKVDVMFVFDSASMGTQRVEETNAFLCEVVKDFDMASGNIRTGILAKNTIDNDVKLDQHPDKNGLIQDLKDRSKSFPELSILIRKLRLHSFTSPAGGRVDAKKRAVIFLSEKLSDPSNVYSEIIRANYWNIDIFVVRIGNECDENIAKSMAKSERHFMQMDSFGDLMKKKDDFVTQFCEV